MLMIVIVALIATEIASAKVHHEVRGKKILDSCLPLSKRNIIER